MQSRVEKSRFHHIPFTNRHHFNMSTSPLSAYRTALRATRIAFKADDFVMKAARDKIRAGFEEKRALTDPILIQEQVQNLSEVSTFLVRNLVQAVRQEDTGKYVVEFHDKIELGDNETIKMKNKASLGSLTGAKAKKR